MQHFHYKCLLAACMLPAVRLSGGMWRSGRFNAFASRLLEGWSQIKGLIACCLLQQEMNRCSRKKKKMQISHTEVTASAMLKVEGELTQRVLSYCKDGVSHRRCWFSYLRSSRRPRVPKYPDPPAGPPGASSSSGPWRRRAAGLPEHSAASSAALWISGSGTRPAPEPEGTEVTVSSRCHRFVHLKRESTSRDASTSCTLPFKSLGSLRNDFIFQRKALFFQ